MDSIGKRGGILVRAGFDFHLPCSMKILRVLVFANFAD